MESNHIVLVAQQHSYTVLPEINAIHEECKRTIQRTLIEFQQKNKNISKDNMIVLGSSCGQYMDYFITCRFRDLDLYVLQREEGYEKVNGVDLLFDPFLHPNYKKRLVLKDGYFFLSKEDLIINILSSGIKAKVSTDIYITTLMFSFLNRIDYVVSLLEEAYSNFTLSRTELYKNYNERLQNQIVRFKRTYTKENLEEKLQMSNTDLEYYLSVK